jgi:hypothetical protein
MAFNIAGNQATLRVGSNLVRSALTGSSLAAPLIITTGESNSGGYGQNSDATEAELAARPVVQILNNETFLFEDLDIGTNNLLGHSGLESVALTRHGIELELANQSDLGDWFTSPIYLCKTGQGGSRVSSWVNPAGSNMARLAERVSRAGHLLKSQNIVYRAAVFLTIGVNDGNDGTSESLFRERLRAYINNVRAVVGARAPIVIPLLESLPGTPESPPTYISDSLAAVASEYENVYTFSTTGFGADDVNHWGYLGLKDVAASFKNQIVAQRDRFLYAPSVVYEFTPSHLWDSGVALWLDAADQSTLFQNSDGTTPATAANDPIGCWLDKSGNGRHATATSGDRPSYNVNPINDTPTINFTTSHSLSGSFAPVTDLSLFLVCRFGSASNSVGRLFTLAPANAADTTAPAFIPLLRGNPSLQAVEAFFATTFRARADIIYDTFFLARVTYTGATVSISINNGSPSTGTGSIAGNSFARYGIGTGFGGSAPAIVGDVAEVIAFDRLITPAEEAAVQSYLSKKWGFSLA